LKPLH